MKTSSFSAILYPVDEGLVSQYAIQVAPGMGMLVEILYERVTGRYLQCRNTMPPGMFEVTLEMLKEEKP